MIKFDCPECGEKMEIKDRMAGREVLCLGCDQMIQVPKKAQPKKPPKRVRPRETADELTAVEWIIYSFLFICSPCLNVFISSILYYSWRREHPNRANQINMLGWTIFGAQILLNVSAFALRRR